MPPAKLIGFISDFTAASVMAAILWLYIDALLFRFEIKSFIKTVGFLLLTAAFALSLSERFLNVNHSFVIWTESIGLWALFVGFIFDAHSQLQLLTLFLIAATLFLKNHLLLSVEAFLVTLVVLQLSYFYKHKDLIPLITAFFLISLAEFLKYLNSFKGFENMALAGSFSYIFAAIILFYWLWFYLTIRFNLKQSKANRSF